MKITIKLLFLILAISGCSKDERVGAQKENAPKRPNEHQEDLNNLELRKAQGLLFDSTRYGNKCYSPPNPPHTLGECAKACAGKMKSATGDTCECLNPYETKNGGRKEEPSGWQNPTFPLPFHPPFP